MIINKHFQKIAIILPILILGSWVFLLETPAYWGTEIRLKIQGYDPRDLLSGHYLLYRVNYDIPSLCKQAILHPINNQCVCFKETSPDTVAKSTWTGNCNERPENCGVYLQGNCEHSQFITGIERFYIPEKFKITIIPKGANVVLKVFNGKASVQDIEVDGTSILKLKP